MYEIEADKLAGELMQPSTSPLKLWEIESFFKCPIVGLCLTAPEQKKILKKTGVPLNNGNLFEIHEILVACAENDNRVSRKTDQLLTQKYHSQISALYTLSGQDFMEHWRCSFRAGRHAPVFWAAATRPDLSEKAKREIFGTIHMSMHVTAENHAHDRRQLEQLQNEVACKAQEIKTLLGSRMDLQREYDAMKRMLRGLQSDLFAARKENDILRNEVEILKSQDQLTDLLAENLRLNTDLAENTRQISLRDQMLNDMKKRVADLTAELENQERENTLFKQEAQDVLHEFLQVGRCDAACPAFDLCRKRVLIVGGIARMETLYRRLIEDNGGVFEYHDGHVYGGTKQLENSLKRADVILCPVNCNSHAACSLVKNLGKKHNKPVHMLAGFSLSAVSGALTGAIGKKDILWGERTA